MENVKIRRKIFREKLLKDSNLKAENILRDILDNFLWGEYESGSKKEIGMNNAIERAKMFFAYNLGEEENI